MIYEYYCKTCKRTFEVEQSIKDEPHQKCHLCGNFSLRRQISKTTFILKGANWSHDNYGAAKKDVAGDD